MGKISIGLATTACLLSTACLNTSKGEKKAPNIIFILSDDLNWGDLGCYGQQMIRTPNIDRIAKEGILFTQAYCGNSVSAPSRSCLMTGLHPGHTRIRDNSYKSYRESLHEEDYTVAMLLKQAGYKTGLFGKWGLSLYDQPGTPDKKGFDEFFGYLNQQQAHTFYPEFLYHNQDRVYFPENADHYKIENYSRPSPYDENGKCIPIGMKNPDEGKYSFDIYCQKSLEFVRQNKDTSFFLYLAYTIPHGALIVPELGEYKDKDWPIQHKEWAAMITRMDTEVGKLLNLLAELGLDQNTIIFFAADNGNSSEAHEKRYLKGKSSATLSDFFNLASPTRGKKGDSYDGAFHVPVIARWPGHIKPNQVSDQIWAFWDFLPTAAEIAGVNPPLNIDGISILPTLLGTGIQKQHEYLYWEFKQNQAIRYGKWFAHKANGKPVELYELISDPQQSQNVSESYPEIVKKAKEIMINSHTPSEVWPSPGESTDIFNKRMDQLGITEKERPDNLSKY